MLFRSSLAGILPLRNDWKGFVGGIPYYLIQLQLTNSPTANKK